MAVKIENGTASGGQDMQEALLTTCGRHHLVKQSGTCTFPDLPDNGTELLVGLVNVALCLDLQRGSHKGKQGGIKHHRAIAVEGHVHADQSLQQNHQQFHTSSRIS